MGVSTAQSNRIFNGVILVGIGILAITQNWWPGILFVIGGAMIIQGIVQGRPLGHYTTALILIAIGIVFQANAMLKLNLFAYWPLILIVIGLVLIFKQKG